MAEFDFYGTWEDSRRILEQLMCLGIFTFVVDKWYTESIPYQVTDLDETNDAILRERRRVYLLSSAYSRFPVNFAGPKGTMMIDERTSGPALDLVLPPCFERNGKTCLRHGHLGYLAYYQNPETRELISPPEELKRIYAQVRSLLRKDMAKRYLDYRTWAGMIYEKPLVEVLWIGHHAMTLLDSGNAGILYGNQNMPDKPYWKTGQDLEKTRRDAISKGEQEEERYNNASS